MCGELGKVLRTLFFGYTGLKARGVMQTKAETDISYGIILNTGLGLGQRVILLDKIRGKIDGRLKTYHRQGLSARGTMVEYRGIMRHQTLYLSYIEPVKLPRSWVRNDILFLHQIIDICTNYIPYQSGQDVFALLMNLYRDDVQIGERASFVRTLLVCRLLALCGLYPDDPSYDSMIISLISSTDDSMLMWPYRKEIEEVLERWLVQTLQHTGAYEKLKTYSYTISDKEVENKMMVDQ